MSTWILLRGLTREARHWGAFPALFCQRLDALPAALGLTLLELPGNGKERARRAPLSVPEMMAWLRSSAAEQGLRPPYRVLAMSLGGMVATAWAQQHSEEIERLVLINTSMQPFCSMPERLRPTAWPAMVCLAAKWGNAQECERIIHDLTCKRRNTVGDDMARWIEIRRSAPVSAVNGLRQLWAAARFSAELEAPGCPTLLLSSALDDLVNPICSTRIAARWGATHAVHPWAGHDLPHDDPQWTCKTVVDWLAAVDDRRATRREVDVAVL